MRNKKEKPPIGATFNKAGYPDKRTLEVIKNWKPDPSKADRGYTELMEFVRDAGRFNFCNSDDWYAFEIEPTIGKYSKPKTRYKLSTGGWSGSEDVICAMEENYMFWMCCWISSLRGGHYVFEI